MQNQLQKNKNFSTVYIIFAITEFFLSIFNLGKRLFYEDLSGLELLISLAKAIYFLLPLVAFIILSKIAAETDNPGKRLKIRKYVLIYIIACFLLGIIDHILESLWDIELPIFPFGLFYSYSWLFHITYIIKFQFRSFIIPLIYEVSFWIISILFIISLGKKSDTEMEFKEETGKTSAGYKFGMASSIILSMQTILNMNLAEAMHEDLSGVTGEHAIGAVFVALILIAIKLILNLILLPALPLSIAGIIKCSSKKEIDQNRKNRRLGKKINIICLVIAVAELVFIW